MTITVTVGELKAGLQAALDLLAPTRDGFKDMSEYLMDNLLLGLFAYALVILVVKFIQAVTT